MYTYRIISSRTLHTANGKSKLLRHLAAPASASLCSDVRRPFLGHAALFTSRQMMESLGERKQLAQPTLPRHMTRALTRRQAWQALIPTAIRVADGSVAMRKSENLVI
jgi:hypothetical protein